MAGKRAAGADNRNLLAVLNHVLGVQGVSKAERRTRAVARPRQTAMYLAKSLTTRSYPDIGCLRGQCDRDQQFVGRGELQFGGRLGIELPKPGEHLLDLGLAET